MIPTTIPAARSTIALAFPIIGDHSRREEPDSTHSPRVRTPRPCRDGHNRPENGYGRPEGRP